MANHPIADPGANMRKIFITIGFFKKSFMVHSVLHLRYRPAEDETVARTSSPALVRESKFSTRITASLPAHTLQNAVLEPTPIEQPNKQRQTQRRDGAIDKGKVGFGHAPVEAEEVAHPQQPKHPSSRQPLRRVRKEAGVP